MPSPHKSPSSSEKKPSLPVRVIKGTFLQIVSFVLAVILLTVGYAAVTWTTIPSGSGASGQPVNQTLVQGIINNMNYLSGVLSSLNTTITAVNTQLDTVNPSGTTLSGGSVCIGGDCKTVWPSGGGGVAVPTRQALLSRYAGRVITVNSSNGDNSWCGGTFTITNTGIINNIYNGGYKLPFAFSNTITDIKASATVGYTDGNTYGIYIDSDTLEKGVNTVTCNVGSFCGSCGSDSDQRLKEDITPLVSPLQKIMKLHGYAFTWKKDGTKDIGVIAQEVEQQFPELVLTDSVDGMKSVKYGNLVAPVIESIKEQQREIEKQSQAIQYLKYSIYVLLGVLVLSIFSMRIFLKTKHKK